MIDKEQQLGELAKIVEAHHIGCNLPKECRSECGMCAANAIYDAGYRKIHKPEYGAEMLIIPAG